MTIIRLKDLAKGFQTILLETNYKGRRTYKSLKVKFKKNPSTLQEKFEKKEAQAFAKQVACKIDYALLRDEFDIDEVVKLNCDFFEYALNFIKENKETLDIRSYDACIKQFQQFLGKKKFSFAELSENILIKFHQYLQKKLNGITPYNYFKKLKRIIRAAVKDKFLRKDPSESIKLNKGQCKDKEVLSEIELVTLWKTNCSNNNVKYAFLFCCQTGLRFCDIKDLMRSDIKFGIIDIIQKKTKVRITIPLNEDAQEILLKMDDERINVFQLPSHTACSKTLRNWVKESGITKHITWHCARHSFGTNLIAKGVDVAVVSKLMGHKNLEQTSRYIRVLEDLKIAAMKKFTRTFD